MPSVLLVHPDAESWLEGVPAAHEVATAPSAKSARAYLAGTPFDLILVGPDVEGAEAIGALRDVLGLSVDIEPVADPAALAARLGADGAGPPAEASGATPGVDLPPAEAASGAEPGTLGDELSRIVHALNNPLAVIAGNTQLALEMAGALGTDESIVESLQAIDQAATELGALFAEVGALRALVDPERG